MHIALTPCQRLVRGVAGRKLNNAPTTTSSSGPDTRVITASGIRSSIPAMA